MSSYRIIRDSVQDQFHKSRAPIQVFGGGFANGKTAAACVKALKLALDYPGSNGLIARASYPKLRDTIQKECLKWCPPDWIKRRPTERDNSLILVNDTVINFRYLQQTGQGKEQGTTSNLLSATYDWAVIDQLDDPEFSEKDLDDLLGRMRGSTPYRGADPSMPMQGPGWLILTLNPTSSWPYRKLVKPVHDYERSGGKHIPEGLLYDHAEKKPIIELFEGPTYDNKHNLPQQFLRNMEIRFTGQYRERYLLGKWAAFEGLVYSSFDPDVHVLRHDEMQDYLFQLSTQHVDVIWLRAYDHGIAAPSCHLIAFCDHFGNIYVIDGYYEPEKDIDWHARKMRELWNEYNVPDGEVYADPSCFRRAGTRGPTVTELFDAEGITFYRGANDIKAGISKVLGYLSVSNVIRNPVRKTWGGAKLYISDQLQFFHDEITSYMWAKNPIGQATDKPVDRNDHAMDCLRYLLTSRPEVAHVHKVVPLRERSYMKWHEPPDETNEDTSLERRQHRYG